MEATVTASAPAEERANDLDGLWAAILEDLRERLTREQFATWFPRTVLMEVERDEVVVGVPTAFFQGWLKDHYQGPLARSVEQVMGAKMRVRLEVAPDAPPLPPRTRPQAAAGQPASMPIAPPTGGVAINPDYTFENFVVGQSNNFAHAACLATAESPGNTYNPLFVHGSVGLGKTHLLQAMCLSILERVPETKILYLSSETFINHFLQALETGDLTNFRHKYRGADVLLVDDIHILANTERTQQEFFHTFNELCNARKQIVVSSDRPPSEIKGLNERLVSRFAMGLSAEIIPPDYETRVAIIRQKAAMRNCPMPDNVAQFIAENVKSNIRELEGAVNTVHGRAQVENAEITLQFARRALPSHLDAPSRAATIEEIINVVLEQVPDVRVSDLLSAKRTKSIARPRQVAMYLARKLTSHSLAEIGGYFGGRDHTTVLYAVDRIGDALKDDPSLRSLVDRHCRALTGNRS